MIVTIPPKAASHFKENDMRYFLLIMIMLVPGFARAADLTLFLQQVARSGPANFVKWTEKYYPERKTGKSGFQDRESEVGSVGFGMMFGGLMGAFKDDMFEGAKEGYQSGSSFGKTFGNGYGYVEGHSQEMEDLITDYINDRQPYIDDIAGKINDCISGGQRFSTCRRSTDIQADIMSISQVNYQYCQEAVKIPSPINNTKTMLDPAICAASS